MAMNANHKSNNCLFGQELRSPFLGPTHTFKNPGPLPVGLLSTTATFLLPVLSL